MSVSDQGYLIAVQEALRGLEEGGIPVGGAIVGENGHVLGRGRNGRVQKGSAILHVKPLLPITHYPLPITNQRHLLSLRCVPSSHRINLVERGFD